MSCNEKKVAEMQRPSLPHNMLSQNKLFVQYLLYISESKYIDNSKCTFLSRCTECS